MRSVRRAFYRVRYQANRGTAPAKFGIWHPTTLRESWANPLFPIERFGVNPRVFYGLSLGSCLRFARIQYDADHSVDADRPFERVARHKSIFSSAGVPSELLRERLHNWKVLCRVDDATLGCKPLYQHLLEVEGLDKYMQLQLRPPNGVETSILSHLISSTL